MSSSNACVQGQRGQVLVEMALVGLVLILMLAGLIDLWRAYYASIAIADAAAEGAAYGAAFPNRPQSDIQTRAAGASGGLVSLDRSSVSVVTDTQTITVTVTYTYPLFTPVVQAIAGKDTLILQERVAERILD